LANAAVAADVEHVVFSGLENVEARTGGTKWAPHFTDKARVEAYIRSLPIRSLYIAAGWLLPGRKRGGPLQHPDAQTAETGILSTGFDRPV
jgi:uncharacterized protein YbjT (DUF2867 family)